MSIKIFAMTHKKFPEPDDPMYIPLQVGRATHDDLGYQGDDTGENISRLNCYYSELTGMYWVWKNCPGLDYVGICHYRRYLLNEQEAVFTRQDLLHLLQHYDMLTSKKLDLNFSYYYGFQENHSLTDLKAADAAVKKLYPGFYPLYEKRIHENHTYFGNMMICKKTLFDEYCAWLFPIFEEMGKHLDLSSYDDYHKRLYGFISEFLLMVWCEWRQLRVKECKVGLIGEKKETTEVKQALSEFFAKGDVAGAKDYFLMMHAKRPDILMEASDTSRHLHLCLQAISTAEYEQDAYGEIRLPIRGDFANLLTLLDRLNGVILRLKAKEATPEDMDFLKNSHLSDMAVYIAVQLHCPGEDPQSYPELSTIHHFPHQR